MSSAVLASIIAAVLAAGTPLMLAACGELVAEKSGMLNLGVEGMMAVGAVTGFIVSYQSGSSYAGLLAAMAAGVALAAVYGWLTIQLSADQVATGLALTIMGQGLASFLGKAYTGKSIQPLADIPLPLLDRLPLLGPGLFKHDAVVYLAVLIVVACAGFLRRTRPGLILAGVGENPQVAQSLGFRVARIRYAAVCFGGAMAGLAGGYLSTAYTPMWADGMVAGQGWIAVGLVVFSTWRPLRLLYGAWLFAGVSVLQLFLQAEGYQVNTYLMSALPYIAVIVALILISRDEIRIKINTPAALGNPYRADV